MLNFWNGAEKGFCDALNAITAIQRGRGHTEQAKLAASVLGRAKTDFRGSSGSVDEIIILGDIKKWKT